MKPSQIELTDLKNTAMIFEPNHIYHIYNQGNNRQKIFFNRENYLFFLKKIGEHILPFADILAWCLMPNHFHLMIYVRESDDLTHRTESEALTNTDKTLNDSIGVLLRSYTRAINKQRNTTGSVFRKKTKAECISKGFTLSETLTNQNETLTNKDETITDKEYLQTCFDYIHQNPTKSGLVAHPEKWEFSSWLDYYGIRNGKLINRERATALGLDMRHLSEGFT